MPSPPEMCSMQTCFCSESEEMRYSSKVNCWVAPCKQNNVHKSLFLYGSWGGNGSGRGLMKAQLPLDLTEWCDLRWSKHLTTGIFLIFCFVYRPYTLGSLGYLGSWRLHSHTHKLFKMRVCRVAWVATPSVRARRFNKWKKTSKNNAQLGWIDLPLWRLLMFLAFQVTIFQVCRVCLFKMLSQVLRCSEQLWRM